MNNFDNFKKATREKQFWASSWFRDWNKRVPTCPHLQVYIVLIIRQVDKQKGKLKLCQACPRTSAFQNRMSNPAGSSYTLLAFLFINLSEMSIQKMMSWNYFELEKNSGCQFTQKNNRASVCKTLCPQHLLAPKYGQVYTVPYFHTKNLDFAEKLNR